MLNADCEVNLWAGIINCHVSEPPQTLLVRSKMRTEINVTMPIRIAIFESLDVREITIEDIRGHVLYSKRLDISILMYADGATFRQIAPMMRGIIQDTLLDLTEAEEIYLIINRCPNKKELGYPLLISR